MTFGRVILIAFLGLSLAFAQEESIENQLSLDDLLALNLSTGSFLELDMNRSPLSLTIIDREKVHNSGARHLSELLEIYVPGFQYMYNKWNGIIWGMRGVAADRNTKILFLVNGHKMNTQSRDGAISEISLGLLGDVERVEVLRGPAGLVYGSGAIGGIVNVVTRRATPEQNFSEARVHLGTYDLGTTESSIEGTVHSSNEDGGISVDFGYRKSEGVGMERARIYGRGSWPYPFWYNDPPQNGALVNGSAESTPGNYKVGLNWEYKGLRIYSRFTHQVYNASGLFILDPWRGSKTGTDPSAMIADTISLSAERPTDGYLIDSIVSERRISVSQDTVQLVSDTSEVWLIPTSTSTAPTNTNVDGQTISDEDWYGRGRQTANNRRQYVVDNIFAELSYAFAFGANELKLSAAVDGVTNRIQYESLAGYEGSYVSERESHYNETFGERRFSMNSTYLLNSISNLQLATGYEWRMDMIGNDLSGKNSQNGITNHIIVADVNYFNHALFLEALYNLRPNLDLHGGVRWDGHTRTMEQRDDIFRVPGILSPKASLIYSPFQGHAVKAIFQSSANNGSADSYEPNRYLVNDAGRTYTEYSFVNPYLLPDDQAAPVPGVTKEELHKLKPERTWSMELATQHRLFQDRFTLGTSISYNTITDLFTWNQALYRTVNAGKYHFITAELEASYTANTWSIGANHSAQRLVNTDVEGQRTMSLGPKFDKTLDWYDTLENENGITYYVPEATSYSDTIYMNAVKDQISADGKNFLNLVPHLSKVFVDWEILPNVVFHTDARIFWGLLGRKDIYNYKKTTTVIETETTYDTLYVIDGNQNVTREIDTVNTEITSSSSNYAYLDDRGYSDNTIFNTLGIEDSPMVKWNISIHWNPKSNVRVSAFIYNVLGQDDGSGSDSYAVNTLRWQQSYQSKDALDLYGVDLRSYALGIEWTF